ncbi:MAG: sigma 54-interacting transcriptional regulator [Deltaproteobacteria bacterium]|nr:sigma 54-interacting transcriptional regulator [Deltaproteobacteria bacterium]
MPFVEIKNKTTGHHRTYELKKRITSIGSSKDCDIVLDDKRIPKHFANIFFDGHSYTLQVASSDQEFIFEGKPARRKKLSENTPAEIGDFILSFIYERRKQEQKDTTDKKDIYKILFETSTKLMSNFKLDIFLSNLTDALISLTKADKGFIIIFRENTLDIMVARSLDGKDITNPRELISDSIIEKVIESRKPLIINDAMNDTEFKMSVSVVNLKLCSVICVPLIYQENILGLIYLGNDNIVNLFDQSSLEIITIFASQVTLLLKSALHINRLEQDLDTKNFNNIIYTSPYMTDIMEKMKKVAQTDVTVLIEGETGTGKEILAREIHNNSPRKNGPFVVINCAAIPKDLLESELFGHIKGAFTGAISTREGKFQLASGGTLFLDEIGDMPITLQTKLLRALQDKTVTKVGSNTPEEVDVRIICATNQKLEELIKNKKFRQDLYYRINVVKFYLPPLRDRGEDIMLIAKYYLEKFRKEYNSPVEGFSIRAIKAINNYTWPGNIREMENRIKKAVILSKHTLIEKEDLELSEESETPILPLAQAREEFQRRYILQALRRNGGNRTKTAKELGVDPRTIFRYLEDIEDETI